MEAYNKIGYFYFNTLKFAYQKRHLYLFAFGNAVQTFGQSYPPPSFAYTA